MLSWLFSEPLPAGAAAPDFTLPDEQGRSVALSALRGKNVILVFYPGDDTSVCTRQLCELRERWPDLASRNTVAFGVNPQGARSHARFREKYGLPFPLLVDAGQAVSRLYHANGLIVKRTVYLIGPDGAIRFSRRGKPSANEILSSAA
ncbi:MAG TPA: peroxiredoxin [Solibacterales bacterium]|nr:peroxiredoxin [Bryobacterales bacterium]